MEKWKIKAKRTLLIQELEKIALKANSAYLRN
jgi:hypothetical protein